MKLSGQSTARGCVAHWESMASRTSSSKTLAVPDPRQHVEADSSSLSKAIALDVVSNPSPMPHLSRRRVGAVHTVRAAHSISFDVNRGGGDREGEQPESPIEASWVTAIVPSIIYGFIHDRPAYSVRLSAHQEDVRKVGSYGSVQRKG